jgi:tRNA pseudouridine38-40 synthase
MSMKSLADSPRRYRLVIAYDGTRYAGWQVQPHHPTIQGELERAFLKLTGEHVRVESSGRTDAGVHAREQVAHVDLRSAPATRKLQLGLNALLPPDIRVMSARRVRADFHARFSASGKEYRYFLYNHAVMPPYLRLYNTWVRKPLDVSAMRRAARLLVGRHDFAAFSANPHRESNGTVRHLQSLRIAREGAQIAIIARADGFLYRMVRSLAGFLIRVGTGELPPDSAKTILRSKSRTARVPTAPPEGLFLWKVFYRR